MAMVFRIVKAVVLLLVTAFVVMVVIGVYTALNAASSYTLSTSQPPMGKAADLSSATSVSSSPSGSSPAPSDNPAKTTPQSASSTAKASSSNTSEQASSGSKPTTSAKPSAQAKNTSTPSAASQKSSSPAIASPSSNSDRVLIPATTTTIHHDATYKTVPVYTTIAYEVCNNCGYKTTSDDDMTAHLKSTHHAGWHEEDIPVQTGTVRVVDTPAWDEKITIPAHYE